VVAISQNGRGRSGQALSDAQVATPVVGDHGRRIRHLEDVANILLS
jgi:hypothetical protein